MTDLSQDDQDLSQRATYVAYWAGAAIVVLLTLTVIGHIGHATGDASPTWTVPLASLVTFTYAIRFYPRRQRS